jgi:hypothetical protein
MNPADDRSLSWRKKLIDVPIESASAMFGSALQSEIIELMKAVFT